MAINKEKRQKGIFRPRLSLSSHSLYKVQRQSRDDSKVLVWFLVVFSIKTTSFPRNLKMATEILHFELNTGAKIPSVGLGTWQCSPAVVGNAVTTAIKVFLLTFFRDRLFSFFFVVYQLLLLLLC